MFGVSGTLNANVSQSTRKKGRKCLSRLEWTVESRLFPHYRWGDAAGAASHGAVQTFLCLVSFPRSPSDPERRDGRSENGAMSREREKGAAEDIQRKGRVLCSVALGMSQ